MPQAAAEVEVVAALAIGTHASCELTSAVLSACLRGSRSGCKREFGFWTVGLQHQSLNSQPVLLSSQNRHKVCSSAVRV